MYIYIYHIYIYVRHSEAFDVRSPAPTFSMGSQRDVAFSSASNPRYPKIQQDSPWKSLWGIVTHKKIEQYFTTILVGFHFSIFLGVLVAMKYGNHIGCSIALS